jgi:hypothetical protein
MKVEVTDNTAKVKEELNNKIALALEEAGLHVEGEAMEELNNDPRRIDTGNLRNSITHIVAPEEDSVYIGTNVEYGVYVHEGTGIYAASGNGRQTPWVYQDNKGNWHVTRGMKPNRFLKNAVERNTKEIAEIINSVLQS